MDYLLKASAITALFYIFYKLILQRETFFQSNRWFLLVGLIATVIVPLIIIPIYVVQDSITLNNFEFVNTNQIVIEKETIDWLQILKYMYVGGVLILSSKFIISLMSLVKLISSNKKEKKKTYTAIETDQNTSPFSFFNYIIYNPNQFKKEELAQIITHEKVHVKQIHSIDMILAQVLVIVFWFNPFSWLYKKEIQQNLEFIADDIAQQKVSSNISYQRLLLKSSISKNQLALTNNFYNSLIKKRIIMLHKNRSKSKNQWKYALILPLILAFVFTFNTKVIAQNNKANHILGEDNIEVYTISKKSTKKDFNKITVALSKTGVSAKFNNIKRNRKGEIMAIKIAISSKNSKSNYSTSSNSEPISPIVITVKNNGESISIGKNEKELIIITEEINKNSDFDSDESVIFITEDANNNTTSRSKTSSSVVVTIKNGDKKENKTFISDLNDDILYYIDGKKTTKAKLKKLNANKIKKMSVIKGDKAIQEYGKEAKNGVILITTKKEK